MSMFCSSRILEIAKSTPSRILRSQTYAYVLLAVMLTISCVFCLVGAKIDLGIPQIRTPTT